MLAALLFSSQNALAQWTQQGPKLVGTGVAGFAAQGRSVALSSNGSTAIVGGPQDNGNAGAAWVFTRNTSGVWTQQGPKLVGTGTTEPAAQGTSVALSSNGSTAIVGGPYDGGGVGAAWVFTRNASGVWTQQAKLVGTGGGGGWQDYSVSLSSNGDTALIGGPQDNAGAGAAWVFTRDAGGVWAQDGPKLVGTGATGVAGQGTSVALSPDATTVIVGGPQDNGNAGAAWVFTPGATFWTQQGPKLVGAGMSGFAQQGSSVSLSSNGNTAIVGGPWDRGRAGTAWVFRRSRAIWSQQPGRLVGTGAIGDSAQGTSLSLSSDGNTAIVGARVDNDGIGAAWIFAVSTGLGVKLVGSGMTGIANQGWSVALSSDGNTAIVGGPEDNGGDGSHGGVGAAWVFVAATPPPPPPELCSWAERTFSHGAKFCMGPTTVLTCDNGKWVASTYASCNTASPIDAK